MRAKNKCETKMFYLLGRRQEKMQRVPLRFSNKMNNFKKRVVTRTLCYEMEVGTLFNT